MQWHTESQFLGPQGHRAQAVTVWSSRWLTRAWKNEDESCWGSCKICCKAKQSYHWPINHFVMPRPGKVGACWSMLEQVVGFQTWGIAQLNMSHGVLALSAKESVCLRKQWLAKACRRPFGCNGWLDHSHLCSALFLHADYRSTSFTLW